MDIGNNIEIETLSKVLYEAKEPIQHLEVSIVSKKALENAATPTLVLSIDVLKDDEDRLVQDDDYEGYKRTILRSFLSKYDNYDMPNISKEEAEKIYKFFELWFVSNIKPIKSKLRIEELYILRTVNKKFIHVPKNSEGMDKEVIAKYDVTLS